MQKSSAVIAIAALAAVAAAPTPSAAFGLRIGPFHIGIPFIGGHRHHVARSHEPAAHTASLRDEAPPSATAPASALTPSSALLYPALALPAAYDDVFTPAAPQQAWPFSYQAIFQTAFAKSTADQGACQQPDSADVVMARIRSAVRPTAAQMPQLQKLGGALHMAAQYLSTTCPSDIRVQPTARMQLMEWQIEKLAQALDIVRPPLAEFQQSLTDAQRARFTAATTPVRPGNAGAAAACVTPASTIDRSIERIAQSVQPTEAQRDALAKVKDAFSAAASGLDAYCPTSPPRDPLARLQSAEARLDATWRAVVAIQSALANFEKDLSDEQRARLDATDFAAL